MNMEELPSEIQFGLETWEPDNLQSLTFLGGVGENWTILIPCKPTLRHWKANQYNMNLRGAPLVNDPRNPLPSGRFQMAIYRALFPINPMALASNFAVMVPGTYFDTGTQTGIYAATTFDFDDVFVLGGSYYIIMRFSDTTASGMNSYQWTYLGWTLADTNLYHAIREDTVTTGALPTTYVTNNLATPANNYPWVRADFV